MSIGTAVTIPGQEPQESLTGRWVFHDGSPFGSLNQGKSRFDGRRVRGAASPQEG